MIGLPCARFVLAAVLTALLHAEASAQTIEFRGRGDPETDALIRRVLAEGAGLIVTRDTLIASTDTIDGRVVVAGATLRLAGVIRGDLFGVDANLFLRPGSRVAGGVTNIGGAFFPAEDAVVGGAVLDRRDALYDAVATSEGARIVGTRRAHVFATDGLRGLRPPSYDRVDGLGVALGARLYLPLVGSVEPALRAHVGYTFRRETAFGRFEAALLGSDVEFSASIERLTATQDEWIRGAVHNTFGYLLFGEDHRDYYRADRGRAQLTWHAGERFDVILGVQAENAKSLSGGDPWTLFTLPDSIRPNPPVDDGRISSADIGVHAGWEAPGIFADARAGIEVAGSAAGGDHEFGRAVLDVDVHVPAFSNHTLGLRLHGQTPLPTSDDLPRQRWGMSGGQGTLESLDVGSLRGDRIVLIRTTYRVPLDPLYVPALGYPAIELIHAAGNAWVRDADADLRQALGLRLRFPLLYAWGFIDPDRTNDARFGIGVSLRRRFAWEDRAP